METAERFAFNSIMLKPPNSAVRNSPGFQLQVEKLTPGEISSGVRKNSFASRVQVPNAFEPEFSQPTALPHPIQMAPGLIIIGSWLKDPDQACGIYILPAVNFWSHLLAKFGCEHLQSSQESTVIRAKSSRYSG